MYPWMTNGLPEGQQSKEAHKQTKHMIIQQQEKRPSLAHSDGRNTAV
jgi:hypothetical protein